MKNQLKVKATDRGMQPAYQNDGRGNVSAAPGRFVGYKLVEVDGRHGFELSEDVVSVDLCNEHLLAIKAGVLEAADAETAKRAGVEFRTADKSEKK